jgi:hypothetical protein
MVAQTGRWTGTWFQSRPIADSAAHMPFTDQAEYQVRFECGERGPRRVDERRTIALRDRRRAVVLHVRRHRRRAGRRDLSLSMEG